MKRFFVLFALLAAAAIQAETARGFHANFNAKSVRGVQVEGEGVMGKTAKRAPAFVPGVDGEAVELDSDELSYPAPGNISLEKGAVSFWIKPIDWGAEQINFLPVFTIDSGNGSGWKILLYFHRDQAGAIWDLRVLTSTRREIICQVPIRDQLKLNDWNHITISWTPQEIEFSFNGSAPRRQTYGLPIKLTSHPKDKIVLMPDNFWRVRNTCKTAIDELQVFSQPLTAVETRSLYLRFRGNQTKASCAAAPMTKAPVTIDGKLAPGEWDDASRLPLMTHANAKKLYTTDPAWVLVKRDEKNLLVAFEVVGKEAPVCGGKANSYDTAIFQGDEVEVDVKAPGKENFRQYFSSPNGCWCCCDYLAKWQRKTGFRTAASIGEDRWFAEMAIPLDEVTVENNALWVNFGAHRRAAADIADKLDRWIAWNNSGKGMLFQDNFGTITLGGEAVRVISLGEPGQGKIDFSMTPAGKLTVTELVTGKTLPLSENGKLDLGAGLYDLAVESPGYFWSSKVEIQEYFNCDFVYDADAKVMEVQSRLLERPEIAAAIKAGKLTLHGEIVDASGKVIASGSQKINGFRDVLKIAFPDPAMETFSLRAFVNGFASPMEVKGSFTVPDRSFIGNRRGVTDKVPAPWQPLKVDGQKVTTAFHQYEFDGGPFPVRAWSQGMQVLLNGGKITGTSLNKNFTLVSRGSTFKTLPDGTVAFSGSAKADNDVPLTLEWQGLIDYDGMIKAKLTFAPAAKGGIVFLSRLQLNFDIAPEAALAAVGNDFDPEWLKSGSASGELYIGATNRRGFAVFSDSDVNIVRDAGAKPFRMTRTKEGKVDMEVDLIRGGAKITTPVEYTLAAMATPGKPPRADWRKIHAEGWLAYPGQNLAVRGWTCEKHLVGYKRGYLLTEPAEQQKASVDTYLAHGIESVSYTCNNIIPSNNPIHDYFAKSWARPVKGEIARISLTREKDGTPYFFGVPVCCNVPGFRDYIIYYVTERMKGSGFSGVYFDFGSVAATDVPFNKEPVANVLTKERPINRNNVFGVREMFKRLRVAIREIKPEGYLWIHAWHEFHPAFMSFVDICNPGEEFMHNFPRDPACYIKDTDFAPLELWRTLYNSESLGVSVQFLSVGQWHPQIAKMLSRPLPETVRERREYTKSQIAMCLLHDVMMSGTGYLGIEGLWPLMDKLELSKANFHGYFEQSEVTAASADVKVSYYDWPDNGKKLIVLVNFTANPVTTALNFAQGTPASLTEAWPEPQNVDAAKITVAGYSFRLLLADKQEK